MQTFRNLLAKVVVLSILIILHKQFEKRSLKSVLCILILVQMIYLLVCYNNLKKNNQDNIS